VLEGKDRDRDPFEDGSVPPPVANLEGRESRRLREEVDPELVREEEGFSAQDLLRDKFPGDAETGVGQRGDEPGDVRFRGFDEKIDVEGRPGNAVDDGGPSYRAGSRPRNRIGAPSPGLRLFRCSFPLSPRYSPYPGVLRVVHKKEAP
jgi:hypothetical protein